MIPLHLTQQGETTCNARDLHRHLGVGRRFTTWIQGRIADHGFVEGEDYVVLDSPNRGNQRSDGFDLPRVGDKRPGRGGDRRSIDYHLTLDMAKELAMLENNAIGRQVRRYFIQLEKDRLHAPEPHCISTTALWRCANPKARRAPDGFLNKVMCLYGAVGTPSVMSTYDKVLDGYWLTPSFAMHVTAMLNPLAQPRAVALIRSTQTQQVLK